MYRINSSAPSAAFMRQWTGSSLIQVMACRLIGTKPLPERMLGCCQLEYQVSLKLNPGFYNFHYKCMKLPTALMVAMLSRWDKLGLSFNKGVVYICVRMSRNAEDGKYVSCINLTFLRRNIRSAVCGSLNAYVPMFTPYRQKMCDFIIHHYMQVMYIVVIVQCECGENSETE